MTAVAAIALGMGCATYTSNTILSQYYYSYGPEETLELLESSMVSPENLALADLEKTMALLELGRYEESLEALRSAEFRIDAGGSRTASSASSASSGGLPPWRPEYHEVVLAPTLGMANSLSIYDVQAAASAADRALTLMAEIGCESCDFRFTRILAALAFGSTGRYGDGIEALDDMVIGGRGEELVGELRRRLDRGVAGFQPEGMAPPPIESERFVVAILLLGRGPFKEADRLALNATETIRWCRYLPRDPQAVSWVAVDLEDPSISVELTDVEELATSALDLRARRVLAGEASPPETNKRDLRHWTSLPASLQLLVVDLEPGVDVVDLVYYSPDGYEIDRETISVPDGWLGGPIFVTRRMP